MDGWTIVMLPDMQEAAAMDRMRDIANWAINNKLPQADVGISSRYVRFKEAQEATFFRLSFTG